MSRPQRKHALRSRVGRTIAAVAVTLAFSFLLEREGAPGYAALSLQARTSPRDVAARVKVVRIDDLDYDSLFGARSPMDPVTLKEVIRAIAAGSPAVIGVVVESIDTTYASLPDSIAGVPIVWARRYSCRGSRLEVGACPAGERVLAAAAGRRDPGRDRAGPVVLPLEPDGSVRRYARVVETESGELPSFTTAVLSRAGKPIEVDEHDRFHLIRYRRTSAADSLFTARWALETAAAGGIAPNGVFHGRIVLLGGSFWQGRDHYASPVGNLAGVEVLAQILETELDGGGARQPGAWQLFLIQCLAGFGIAAIFHRRELPSAFGLSLALCAVAAPAASLLAFGTWKLWFYFLPALGAWLVQQLYDEAQAYRDGLLLGSKVDAGFVSESNPAGHPPATKSGATKSGRTPPETAPTKTSQSPSGANKGRSRRRRK